MKILRNENNKTIIENGKWIYLVSYNSVIAKVNNNLDEEYGFYIDYLWDYSQTTLKHLYDFIELFTTQRDDKGNTFAYSLDLVNNKKEYIKKQLELGNIKMIREDEM